MAALCFTFNSKLIVITIVIVLIVVIRSDGFELLLRMGEKHLHLNRVHHFVIITMVWCVAIQQGSI